MSTFAATGDIIVVVVFAVVRNRLQTNFFEPLFNKRQDFTYGASIHLKIAIEGIYSALDLAA